MPYILFWFDDPALGENVTFSNQLYNDEEEHTEDGGRSAGGSC